MPTSSAIELHRSPKAVFLAGTRPARPTFTEEEMETARRDAYMRGSLEATKMLERQMLEQRGELVHLQSETFARLAKQHEALTKQLQDMIPAFTLEAVARVLGGMKFDRDGVAAIVADLLGEVAPGRDQVEVALAPSDLDLIAGYDASFREKHPELIFRADPELRSGDCLVRTKFGVIDGRLATKLRALEDFLK